VTRARVKLALVAGLSAGIIAIVVTLLGSPIAIARINVPGDVFVGEASQVTRECQSGEVLPRETTAVRLRTYAFLGPRVTVEVLEHGRVIAHGARGSGWTGGAVTVRVNRLSATKSGVKLCFTLYINGHETIEYAGQRLTGALAARGPDGPLEGRVRVEDLRPGSASWLSITPEVARRMGIGHAASGTWSVFLVIALMGGLLALCSRLILRELE
jgi:hypothetical protein